MADTVLPRLYSLGRGQRVDPSGQVREGRVLGQNEGTELLLGVGCGGTK